MRSTLRVYRASAGSGKTFTLAVEYIKLLIVNPESFRNILAVTFTNKATEEMKMRILSQLYGLSHRLKDSQSYMSVLKDELRAESSKFRAKSDSELEEYIVTQSEEALHLLLHNYHYFRVQTIDTFFQTVLRNLARELQLNANLRVGLNNKQVVEEAVDELVDSLSGEENKHLKKVVMGYIHDNMEQNKGWNVINNIKEFGGTIFKEFYKQHREEMNRRMSSPTFFEDYKKSMNHILHSLPEKYRKIGDDAMQVLQEHGLDVNDFCYGKGGAIGYFLKMAEGNFFDIDMTKPRMSSAYSTPSSWVSKTSSKYSVLMSLVEDVLLPLMKSTEPGRSTDARSYLSAIVTRRHINDLQLLKDIENYARNINDAAQRFMLSDTQSLLSEMVKGEDSPFVFEKIGARLEHIMIDEFQDTSTIQWSNFKKLLEECMSRGNSNLIVGDVKQSIYRFRSGDWRLLNSIDREFSADQLDFQPRKTNYRSDRNIVAFNNAFFEIASRLEVAGLQQDAPVLATQVEKAYEDVCQLIPKEKPVKGLVNIELLPDEEYKDMNNHVIEIIDTLLERGARQKDIAIIVRANSEAVSLARDLESHGVSVVSAEAFKLSASMSVRIIVGAMRHLSRPEDALTLALLKKDLGEKEKGKEGKETDVMLESFTAREDEIRALSLHDMAEEIACIFHLGGSEGAYLSSFYDQLHNFASTASTLLTDFLKAWDDDIKDVAIETSDCDGVRILTIHKSKGLEFKHVILPYCNWRLEKCMGQIWCQPKASDFDKMPIVPIDYSSYEKLKNTIYKEDVIEEHVQNIVDNLNLLYVAMTRAESSLFVIGRRAKANKNGKTAIKRNVRSGLIEEVVNGFSGDIAGEPLNIYAPKNDSEAITVTYGSIDSIFGEKEKEKEASQNVFLPEIESVTVPVCSMKNTAVFRQSNESRSFADDEYDKSDRQRYIRMGTVMHQVFSEIRTLDDVLPVLQKMEFDGALYDEALTKEALLAEMRKKFADAQIRDWFSDRWTLFNECTILARDDNGTVFEQRPDRVMTDGQETVVVDFKFGKPMGEHYDQVHRYMELLTEMGMPNVKGYLWYVTFDEVKKLRS